MVGFLVWCLAAPHVAAASDDAAVAVAGYTADVWPATAVAHDPWHVSWQLVSGEGPTLLPAASPPTSSLVSSSAIVLVALSPDAVAQSSQNDQPPLHAAAIEHSDGYHTRQKIHKYASFATLPLFAAQLALGQSLYNNTGTSGAQRTAHAWVGAGIVSLFGVNTVTGAWNLFGEGRMETEGYTLRLVHGLLMMAADAGFVAATISTPGGRSRRNPSTYQANASTHRNLAVVSISIATGSYLLMLFGNH